MHINQITLSTKLIYPINDHYLPESYVVNLALLISLFIPAFGITSTPAFGMLLTQAFGMLFTPDFGMLFTPNFGMLFTPAFGMLFSLDTYIYTYTEMHIGGIMCYVTLIGLSSLVQRYQVFNSALLAHDIVRYNLQNQLL